MTKDEVKEIIKQFKYSDKQRDYWTFLGNYSSKLEEWLLNNTFNKEQLLRYMLIGLFLHYRGCVHRSNTLTTDIEKYIEKNLGIRESDKRLFSVYNKIAGRPVKDTQDYISLIKLEELNNINEDSLFDFVINGTPIG